MSIKTQRKFKKEMDTRLLLMARPAIPRANNNRSRSALPKHAKFANDVAGRDTILSWNSVNLSHTHQKERYKCISELLIQAEIFPA